MTPRRTQRERRRKRQVPQRGCVCVEYTKPCPSLPLAANPGIRLAEFSCFSRAATFGTGRLSRGPTGDEVYLLGLSPLPRTVTGLESPLLRLSFALTGSRCPKQRVRPVTKRHQAISVAGAKTVAAFPRPSFGKDFQIRANS